MIMQTPTTPVVVETKYGKLYIVVARAERDSYHDMERGSVTDLRPVVWAASDPAFTANPNAAEHWTIRGRAYAVHHHLFYGGRGLVTQGWNRDSPPYAGGFRADHGGQVERTSKTFDLMWEATTTALDTFHADYPGWEELSRYLLLNGDGNSAHEAAEQARAEAVEQDKVAEEFRVMAARIAASLPPALDRLIIH